MSGCCCFPGFVIILVRIHLTASLVLFLVMIFLLKLFELKIFFHSPSDLDQVLFSTLEFIVRTKRKKLILHMNLFKAFIFQHDLNLNVIFFSQIKEASHDINLLCDRKYEHEIEKKPFNFPCPS